MSALIYASRISAKVDNTALQDGFQLYQHSLFFTKDGKWSVLRQGMNEKSQWARQYHWLGSLVTDFVCEPEAAICCDQKAPTLNLAASESKGVPKSTTELARQDPSFVIRELVHSKTLQMPKRHIGSMLKTSCTLSDA